MKHNRVCAKNCRVISLGNSMLRISSYHRASLRLDYAIVNLQQWTHWAAFPGLGFFGHMQVQVAFLSTLGHGELDQW